MLIPLLDKEQLDLTGNPISADLTQRKPKRGAKQQSGSTKKNVMANTLPELRATIERIFAHEDAILITTQAELIEFLRQQDVFGLDTETTGLKFYKDKIAGFSVGTATRSAYIPLQHVKGQNYQDDIVALCEILHEKSYYGFNWVFDQHFLEHFNPLLANLPLAGEGSSALRCYDIALPHALKDVYKAVIDPTYEEYSFKKLFKGVPFTEFDPKDVYKYAAVDARKHYVITEYFENRLREEIPDVYYRYRSIELRLLSHVCSAEEYGICLSNAQVDKLYNELENQKIPLLEKIKDIAEDPEFNPSSPKQVIEAFSKIGHSLSSTGEATLSKIAHPLAEAILAYRGIIKLQGTYTTNLYEFTDVRDGNTIVHSSFNTIGADTGRMSSKNPNLQNIPRDPAYRAMFVARPGHKMISVDYSQQEVRILAVLARDQTMIEAFKSGKDFYALMASIVFNLPYDNCVKGGPHSDKRNQMKAVVLGLNYSMGVKTLAMDLGLSEAETQTIIDKFNLACPKVAGFQKHCLDFAKTHGFNETLFKHRRYYKGLGYAARGLNRFEIFGPGLKNGDVTEEEVVQTLNSFGNNRYRIKEFIADLQKPANKKDTKHLAIYVNDRESAAFAEERQCTNSVIQGTGAEMTKLAIIVTGDDPELAALNARMINFVHDEIIIEAPIETAERAGWRLAEIMNDVSADMLDGLSGGCEPQFMDVWTKD